LKEQCGAEHIAHHQRKERLRRRRDYLFERMQRYPAVELILLLPIEPICLRDDQGADPAPSSVRSCRSNDTTSRVAGCSTIRRTIVTSGGDPTRMRCRRFVSSVRTISAGHPRAPRSGGGALAAIGVGRRTTRGGFARFHCCSKSRKCSRRLAFQVRRRSTKDISPITSLLSWKLAPICSVAPTYRWARRIPQQQSPDSTDADPSVNDHRGAIGPAVQGRKGSADARDHAQKSVVFTIDMKPLIGEFAASSFVIQLR